MLLTHNNTYRPVNDVSKHQTTGVRPIVEIFGYSFALNYDQLYIIHRNISLEHLSDRMIAE